MITDRTGEDDDTFAALLAKAERLHHDATTLIGRERVRADVALVQMVPELIAAVRRGVLGGEGRQA